MPRREKRSSHRRRGLPAAAVRSCPGKRSITTEKYQLARPAIADRNPGERIVAASMSIVAQMSPTTQQHQHSPDRRRKSMLLTRSGNIKVIVFSRTNTALAHAFAAKCKVFQGKFHDRGRPPFYRSISQRVTKQGYGRVSFSTLGSDLIPPGRRGGMRQPSIRSLRNRIYVVERLFFAGQLRLRRAI
jgi:hypothetical protein